MARPTWVADCAVPWSVTSPLCACTSRLSEDSSLSAWSLFFTIVMITESSIDPVGAPAPASRVRTIVTEWSRSAWMSVGLRRHSVMRVLRLLDELLPPAATTPLALVELVPLEGLLA